MQLVPASPIAPLFYGVAVTACCQTCVQYLLSLSSPVEMRGISHVCNATLT